MGLYDLDGFHPVIGGLFILNLVLKVVHAFQDRLEGDGNPDVEIVSGCCVEAHPGELH